jgi:PIN domain nuclease of toxin-antitoxin system
MRYYLDTNIIAYYLFERNNLDYKVLDILSDPSEFFYASCVAVKELIHLAKQGRIKLSRKQNGGTILDLLNEAGITIKPITIEHLKTYETLAYVTGHNDPNDMLIIAQAISDRIPLISSDRIFESYRPQGLDFVYNKR